MHAVEREAHGIRKLRLQEEKIGDSIGFKFRSAGLAIGFKRGATAQQTHPIEIVGMLIDDKVSVEKDAEITSSLDIFTQLDKVPGFVVIHSSGGNSA